MSYHHSTSHYSSIKVHGKNCPFFKSCPYLGGESPTKVFAERNYLRQRVNQMETVLGFAEKEIIKLKEQVNQLEGEKKSLEEDLTQAKQAPFKKRERRVSPDSPRKRGAPVGHPGTSRKRPETIDEYIIVHLPKCSICSSPDISPCNRIDEHIQEDIVIQKIITRAFIHFYYWCPHCKKIVSGCSENEIPKASIGPVAKAIASFLRYEIKISYDDIQRILQNVFGLKITSGAIVGFDNKVYQKGLPLYETLKKMLPYQAVQKAFPFSQLSLLTFHSFRAVQC